ncbi:Hpt domain-containing protein [Roseibium sp.]|uniref:Hpt domain-containing protein n=1 Tax=Roseibium sp. TaxID=1936156 RepID=UPI0039EE939F
MADPAKDQQYEILTPPSNLRSKVRELTPREAKKFDPVKAAEAALSRLSHHFGGWMDNETKALMSAWEKVESDGINEETIATLFQAAHNIKGQALTLGFPLVGDVAANMCHLIEAAPSPEAIPAKLTGQYVDAIRAMVIEGAKDDGNETGVELLKTLQTVTDELVATFPPKPEDA